MRALTWIALLPVTACAPGAWGRVDAAPPAVTDEVPRTVVGELAAGPVRVRIEREADGRYDACVASVDGEVLPERPLCVGPHDGSPGPDHLWTRADRLASGTVVVLALMGPDDRLLGDGLGTHRVTGTPVAVAAGVQAHVDRPAVCATYEWPQGRVAASIGITTERVVTSGPASPCA